MTRRFAVTLVVVAVSQSCGGSPAPSTPSEPGTPGSPGGTCRNYATEFAYVSAGPGFFANTTARCTFSTGARTLTCTFSQTSNVNTCSVDFRWQDSYGSVADFIDESRVVGRFLLTERAQQPVQTATSCTPPGVPGTTTYSYDGTRRMTQSVAVNMTGAGGPATTYAYTAWDGQGRPTQGTVSIGGASFPVAVTYDDAARTMTISAGPGGAANSLNTITFDADGNIVRSRGESSGFVTESAYTITGRQAICQ
jgi:hypothetical protein